MLLDGESLLEVAHEVTSYIVYLRPLFEYEDYAQHDKCCCKNAHPAHETMRLSTTATNMKKTNKNNENEKLKDDSGGNHAIA